jgi:hypothetical protein
MGPTKMVGKHVSQSVKPDACGTCCNRTARTASKPALLFKSSTSTVIPRLKYIRIVLKIFCVDHVNFCPQSSSFLVATSQFDIAFVQCSYIFFANVKYSDLLCKSSQRIRRSRALLACARVSSRNAFYFLLALSRY